MDQVSRPMLIALVAVVAFAAVWLVALRPKPAASPDSQPAVSAQPAPAEKPKSALPGALGGAVDQARTAKSQGDAAAAARPGQVDAAAGDTPAGSQPSGATPAAKAAAPSAAAPAARERVTRAVARAEARRPRFATPAKVRVALARGQAVVLLFYSARASDDRAVRGELAAVSRRRGRVKVWGVSVNGLARFKNVLRGVQVLQTPSVVLLRRGTSPVLFAGFTDHAEIDQAAAVALRR